MVGLTDYEKVIQVINNFYFNVDMKNLEGTMACLDENSRAVILGNETVGWVAIKELFAEVFASMPHMKHLGFNPIVDDITGDEAHLRIRYYGNSEGELGPSTGWGYAQVALKRKNNAWLIIDYNTQVWPDEK